MCGRFEKNYTLLRSGTDTFVSKSDLPDWLLDIQNKYEDQTRVVIGEYFLYERNYGVILYP
jgi:hypothetical protein